MKRAMVAASILVVCAFVGSYGYFNYSVWYGMALCWSAWIIGVPTVFGYCITSAIRYF